MSSQQGALRRSLPFQMVSDLTARRQLIGQFAWRDAVVRYKGSFLGILWSFITPLLMLAIYAVVFGLVFPGKWGNVPPEDFVMYLFCGLIVFNVFAECVQRAPTLILVNPNYVKRVVFPVEVLPAAALGSSLINGGSGLVILIPAWLIVHHTISSTIWLFPLVLVPLCALTLGIAWLLSALGVFVRDLGHPVFIVMQAMFFLSGIFFPISAVPSYLHIPMLLNPMTTILEDSRRTLLWGMVPYWSHWAIVTAGSLALLLIGYFAFMRSKKAFADVM
jgi:lipopolysaccharide transport system permease protein